MNYAKNVFKLREQILKFAGELHTSILIDQKIFYSIFQNKYQRLKIRVK